MENSDVSIFQLLTQIEKILKNYGQTHQDTEQVQKIMRQLKNFHFTPQIIFQQIIPNRQLLRNLKFTLYKQILQINSRFCLDSMERQSLKHLDFQQDKIGDSRQIQEIILKINAIKGETMFINQQLSVQALEEQSDQFSSLQDISLRKLIKEFLKKCKSSTRLHFLTPLCIRLVVLQQTIMAYLEKSLSTICGILEEERQCFIEKKRATVHTVKSVSSLSASIEQFLERQNQSNSEVPTPKASVHLPHSESLKPVIRTDFNLLSAQKQQVVHFCDHKSRNRKGNCCFWF